MGNANSLTSMQSSELGQVMLPVNAFTGTLSTVIFTAKLSESFSDNVSLKNVETRLRPNATV